MSIYLHLPPFNVSQMCLVFALLLTFKLYDKSMSHEFDGVNNEDSSAYFLEIISLLVCEQP